MPQPDVAQMFSWPPINVCLSTRRSMFVCLSRFLRNQFVYLFCSVVLTDCSLFPHAEREPCSKTLWTPQSRCQMKRRPSPLFPTTPPGRKSWCMYLIRIIQLVTLKCICENISETASSSSGCHLVLPPWLTVSLTSRAMMMTGCDLSAITKPWEVQSKVGGLHSLHMGWLKHIYREVFNVTLHYVILPVLSQVWSGYSPWNMSGSSSIISDLLHTKKIYSAAVIFLLNRKV